MQNFSNVKFMWKTAFSSYYFRFIYSYKMLFAQYRFVFLYLSCTKIKLLGCWNFLFWRISEAYPFLYISLISALFFVMSRLKQTLFYWFFAIFISIPSCRTTEKQKRRFIITQITEKRRKKRNSSVIKCEHFSARQ